MLHGTHRPDLVSISAQHYYCVCCFCWHFVNNGIYDVAFINIKTMWFTRRRSLSWCTECALFLLTAETLQHEIFWSLLLLLLTTFDCVNNTVYSYGLKNSVWVTTIIIKLLILNSTRRIIKAFAWLLYEGTKCMSQNWKSQESWYHVFPTIHLNHCE